MEVVFKREAAGKRSRLLSSMLSLEILIIWALDDFGAELLIAEQASVSPGVQASLGSLKKA